MFSNKFHYSVDEETSRIPFTSDELEIVLDKMPSNLLKDKKALKHFISRALSTSLELRRVRELYAKEVEERTRIVANSAPASVNPMHAAQFLSPQQKSKLFDKFAQEKLAALEESKARADLRTRQAEEVISGVLSIVNSGNFQESTYDNLVSFLKSLGFPVVDTPVSTLDFADPRLLDPAVKESAAEEAK